MSPPVTFPYRLNNDWQIDDFGGFWHVQHCKGRHKGKRFVTAAIYARRAPMLGFIERHCGDVGRDVVDRLATLPSVRPTIIRNVVGERVSEVDRTPA